MAREVFALDKKNTDKILTLLMAGVCFISVLYLVPIFTGNLSRIKQIQIESPTSGERTCEPAYYCQGTTTRVERRVDCSTFYLPCSSGLECFSGKCVSSDYDGDGLLNNWEDNFGLKYDKIDSDGDTLPDSEEDPDLDQFTNLQEFKANTLPADKNSKPQSSRPKILAHFGSYIDTDEMTPELWSEYTEMSLKLRDLGFTHAGIKLWSGDLNPEIASQRISQLRQNNLKIAVNKIVGRETLLSENGTDPQNHSSNNQNLKFFGAYNFNPYVCNPGCNCVTTERNFHRTAIDPGYSGTLWQEELASASGVSNLANLQQDDVMIFDTEIQGLSVGDLLKCYPTALDDGGRYDAFPPEERQARFMLNWRLRAEELYESAKSQSPNALILHYNEILPSIYDLSGTSSPPGVGDAQDPFMYRLPNLGPFRYDLGDNCNNNFASFNCSRVNERDFSNSYVWINFGDAKRAERGGTGQPNVYAREHLDPKLAQKFGYYLFKEQVKGVFFYPQTFTYQGMDGDREFYYIDRPYLRSMKGFMKGFNGEDPGDIRNSGEICGDDVDNNGDYFCDENCPGVGDLDGKNFTDCDSLNMTLEVQHSYDPLSRFSAEDISGDTTLDEERVLTDGFKDLDSDGFLNIEEVWSGTDISNTDSDGDRIIDGKDKCPSVPNPGQDNVNDCFSQYSFFNYSGTILLGN